MKFLVILICLTINYLWLKDFDRFDDTWFFRFRRRMEDSIGSRETSSTWAGLAPLLFIYENTQEQTGFLLRADQTSTLLQQADWRPRCRRWLAAS